MNILLIPRPRRTNGRKRRPSSLSDEQRAEAEALLAPLCDVPSHVRDQLREGFYFDGPSIVLYESRPRFQRPSEWGEHGVAKFTYVKSRRVWRLFCQFRDLQWHAYEPLPEATSLARLVAEVDDDPTGIFWG